MYLCVHPYTLQFRREQGPCALHSPARALGLCQNFSSSLFPEAFLEGGDCLILVPQRTLCSPMSGRLHLELQPITPGFLLLRFPRWFNNADIQI